MPISAKQVDRWLARFDALLAEARGEHRPLVLLWGPGKHDRDGYGKREKIRNEILKENPEASVVFPEEEKIRGIAEKFVKDPDLQEDLESEAADLIFALDVSSGVAEEVSRYSYRPRTARKLLVLTTEERQRGFSGIVRERLNVEVLSDEDVKDCETASEVCRNEVRSWLIGRLLGRVG